VNAAEFHLVALPLTALFYGAIIAAEEAYLRDTLGAEFDACCARVNRILPRLSGFRTSVANMRFNTRRVLVKDCSTIVLSVLLLAGLVLGKDVVIRGRAALPSTGRVLLSSHLGLLWTSACGV
jgi:hypothetical protein